jgi:hypothetical protein
MLYYLFVDLPFFRTSFPVERRAVHHGPHSGGDDRAGAQLDPRAVAIRKLREFQIGQVIRQRTTVAPGGWHADHGRLLI